MARKDDQALLDEIKTRVLKHSIPEPNSGCWLWTAWISDNGYGSLNRKNASRCAHRASYEVFKGPIPEGLDLDHLCRVRSCVNPDHLEPVTRQVNLLRGKTLPAEQVLRTHCPEGHLLSGSNLYLQARGRGYLRSCRVCRNRCHGKRRAA